MKIVYEKLVRDGALERIAADGGRANYRNVYGHELYHAMKMKLLEEVNEYLKNPSIEELADILDIVVELSGWHEEDLSDTAKQKRLDRGGFGRHIFLESVEFDVKEKKEI